MEPDETDWRFKLRFRCEAYRTVQVEADMGEVKQTKQIASECEKRAAQATSEGDRQQLLQIRDRLKNGDQPTMPRVANLGTARLQIRDKLRNGNKLTMPRAANLETTRLS